MDKTYDPAFIAKLLRSEVGKLRDKFGQPFVDLLISLEGELKAGNVQESRFFSQKLYDLIMGRGDSRLRGWLSERLEANQHHAMTLPSERGGTEYPLSHVETGFEFEGVVSDNDSEMPKAKMKEDVKASHSASVPAKGVDAVDSNAPPLFHFTLEGDEDDKGNFVSGNRVVCGRNANLVFRYEVPSDIHLLAKVRGKKLNEVLKEDGDLEISVIPHGFELRDPYSFFQKARFRKGRLESPVIFGLKARKHPGEDLGVMVMFSCAGRLLYKFRILLNVVKSLDVTLASPQFTPQDFDLDALLAARGQPKRRATLQLTSFGNGDQILVSFVDHDPDPCARPFMQRHLPLLTVLRLGQELNRVLGSAIPPDKLLPLAPVIDNSIWTKALDPLLVPGTDADVMFVERVATVGYRLFSALCEDPVLAPILRYIDEHLPPDAVLSIWTDVAFIPWEILSSKEYKYADLAESKNIPDPQRFWGFRFNIECLFVSENHQETSADIAHYLGPPLISIYLNPMIEEQTKGSAFMPLAAHESWAEKLSPGTVEIHRGYQAFKDTLKTAEYGADFIYILAHGSNSQPFKNDSVEMLQLEEEGFVEPVDITKEQPFSHGPVVFLNSCRSGAYSPLALTSFLKKFVANKNAIGVVATMFPIPATVGAAIGIRIMQDYVDYKAPLGEVLLGLRRELLSHGNPFGLFYSLQCPIDVTAPLITRRHTDG